MEFSTDFEKKFESQVKFVFSKVAPKVGVGGSSGVVRADAEYSSFYWDRSIWIKPGVESKVGITLLGVDLTDQSQGYFFSLGWGNDCQKNLGSQANGIRVSLARVSGKQGDFWFNVISQSEEKVEFTRAIGKPFKMPDQNAYRLEVKIAQNGEKQYVVSVEFKSMDSEELICQGVLNYVTSSYLNAEKRVYAGVNLMGVKGGYVKAVDDFSVSVR